MRKLVEGDGDHNSVTVTHGAALVESFVSYWHPSAYFIQKCTAGRANGFVNYMRQGRVSTRLLLAIYPEMKKAGIEVKIRWQLPPKETTRKTAKSARKFQEQAVGVMLKSPVGGILWLATAAGKTKTVGEYCRVSEGKHIFIVDERTLLSQAIEELENHLAERVGVAGSGMFQLQRVVVATAQTLLSLFKRKDDRYKLLLQWAGDGLKSVIVDECHVMANKRTESILTKLKPAKVFGLTATIDDSHKHSRLPVFRMFGPVLIRYTLEQGQAEGILAKGYAIQIKRHLEVKGKGDYLTAFRRSIVENSKRTLDVVTLAMELLQLKHRVVVLVGTSPHLARIVAQVFQANKIRTAEISGLIDRRERFATCKKFDAGEIDVIVANNVFSKGVNIKTITAIIDCSSGSDSKMTIQKFGRGTRTTEQKTAMVYFDIADLDSRRGNFRRAATARYKAYQKEKIPVARVLASRFTWKQIAEAGHRMFLKLNGSDPSVQSKARNAEVSQAPVQRPLPT